MRIGRKFKIVGVLFFFSPTLEAILLFHGILTVRPQWRKWTVFTIFHAHQRKWPGIKSPKDSITWEFVYSIQYGLWTINYLEARITVESR